jgi:hypothetical protein
MKQPKLQPGLGFNQELPSPPPEKSVVIEDN